MHADADVLAAVAYIPGVVGVPTVTGIIPDVAGVPADTGVRLLMFAGVASVAGFLFYSHSYYCMTCCMVLIIASL